MQKRNITACQPKKRGRFFIFFPVILTKLIKGKMVWLFLVTVWSFVTRFYVVDIT